ncbi:MAG: hypothetical protein WD069_19465 [Planctomycetales bacterium]
MSGWLAKAPFLSRPAAGPPGPYSLTCGCGQLVEGMRTAVAQDVACPVCGARLYVLPRSVYPPAGGAPARPAPPDRTTHREKRERGGVVEPPARGAGRAVRRTLSSWKDRTGDAVARARRRGRELAAERSGAARRAVTPFRLVVLAVAGVLVVTGWWMWRQRALERAEATLRESLQRGTAALAAREFPAAAREYAAAAGALDVLGRDDSFAGDVRQASRQLSAMDNLLSVPLEEALADLRGAPPDNGFAIPLQHSERWLVFDTFVRRVAGPDEDACEIDYPLAIDGLPVVWIARPPAFAGLDIGDGPQPAIFAARLASARDSDRGPARLFVELDAASLFLWTNADYLAHLGILPDARVEAILEAQARVVGGGR